MPIDRDSQVAELQQQIAVLNDRYRELEQMITVENVLANGFEGLSAQLAPLRDLAPRRTPFDQESGDRLRNLRDAMKRPSWKSGGSLSVKEERVPFIGEKSPERMKAAIAAAEAARAAELGAHQAAVEAARARARQTV